MIDEGMRRVAHAIKYADSKGYTITYGSADVGIWKSFPMAAGRSRPEHIHFIKYKFDPMYNVVRYTVNNREFTNLQEAVDHVIVLRKLGVEK